MVCPHCGAQNPDGARFCTACRAQFYSQQAAPVATQQAPLYVPRQTSGLAIASFILGVLGFLACGITAIPGVILGIIAAVQINANRHRLTGQGFAIAGIATSGAAILLWLAVTNWGIIPLWSAKARGERQSTCFSNLRQAAQALSMYCDDFDGTLPSSQVAAGGNYETFGCTLCAGGQIAFPSAVRLTVWEMLYDNMRNKDIMWCPSDPASRIGVSPVVSYWYKYAMDRAWAPPINARRMGDYDYESDQIAFFEHSGWHHGRDGGLQRGVEINASFVDGHVEKITLPGSGPLVPVNTPAGATGPYEPFYYNCQVDYSGNEYNPSTGPLPVNVYTGAFVDPRSNYDKL